MLFNMLFFKFCKRIKGREGTNLRPLQNEDMSLCLFPFTFLGLFVLNPTSSQNKTRLTERRGMTPDPWRPCAGLERWVASTWSMLPRWEMGCGSFVLMPRWRPINHMVSVHRMGEWKSVEFCSHLRSLPCCTPLQILGGNLDYAQEEGNLFYLLILLHYHLYTISVYRSRVPLPSHELYGFPCVESLTSPGSCQAVTVVPLHIVLRIECVPVFWKGVRAHMWVCVCVDWCSCISWTVHIHIVY